MRCRWLPLASYPEATKHGELCVNDVMPASALPEVTSEIQPRPEDLEWAEAMFEEWERRFAGLRRQPPAICAESRPTADR